MNCFCCGKEIPDDALFCKYCGANIKSFQESKSSNIFSKNIKNIKFNNKPKKPSQLQQIPNNLNHPYSKFGGFLAFVYYYGLIETIIYAISVGIAAFACLYFMFIPSPFSWIFILTLFIFPVCILYIVWVFKFLQKLKSKQDDFISYYFKALVVQACLCIVVAIIYMIIINSISSSLQQSVSSYSYSAGAIYNSYASSIISSSFVYLIFCVCVSLLPYVLLFVYFVKSVRVRTYMGSDKYTQLLSFAKSWNWAEPAVYDNLMNNIQTSKKENTPATQDVSFTTDATQEYESKQKAVNKIDASEAPTVYEPQFETSNDEELSTEAEDSSASVHQIDASEAPTIYESQQEPFKGDELPNKAEDISGSAYQIDASEAPTIYESKSESFNDDELSTEADDNDNPENSIDDEPETVYEEEQPQNINTNNSPAIEKRFCGACGAKVKSSSSFCQNCGNKL